MTDASASLKLRIAVLFGGRSAEHDVSVLSARNVMRALEPARYDAVPVFITREGKWLLSSFEDDILSKPEDGTEVCLVPGGRGRMIAIPTKGSAYDLPKIDIVNLFIDKNRDAPEAPSNIVQYAFFVTLNKFVELDYKLEQEYRPDFHGFTKLQEIYAFLRDHGFGPARDLAGVQRTGASGGGS